MRRDWLQLAVLLLTAALGVLAVGLALNGVVGQALVYGSAICAITGMVCLAVVFLAGRGGG